MRDGHLDTAVTVVVFVGHNRHARNGRVCAGRTEWIDVDSIISRPSHIEGWADGIQHSYQAVDLLCRRVATVVRCREGVSPQQGERSRAWQASVLLWTVDVI